MVEMRHKSREKTSLCSISGCTNTAVRSLPTNKLSSVLSGVVNEKRSHLCKQHYKEFKKKTKEERTLETLGW